MSEFEGRVVGRLRYKLGDLFAGDESVIAHGCNAMGKMGKGFAYALAAAYPEAKEAYLKHGTKNGYRLGEVIPWLGPTRKVLHLIVQQRIRQQSDPRGIRYVDYGAVERAFEMIERGAARHIERKEGFWRMRELAPDRFYASEYFRSYYSQTRLAEEVGFFVPLPGKDALVLSLMRLRASGPFGTADARLLRDMAPAVISLARLRWPALPADEPAESMQDETLPAVNEFDRAHIWESLSLTPREKHVVDLVLQGQSTESIARAMRIVPGTLKVHRRNIYRKLKIKSQAGLFARFVEIIEARIR